MPSTIAALSSCKQYRKQARKSISKNGLFLKYYYPVRFRYQRQSPCDIVSHPTSCELFSMRLHIGIILKAFTFCSSSLCSRFVLPAYVHVLFFQPPAIAHWNHSNLARLGIAAWGKEKMARSRTYVKGPSLKFFRKTIFDIHKFSVI